MALRIPISISMATKGPVPSAPSVMTRMMALLTMPPKYGMKPQKNTSTASGSASGTPSRIMKM